MQRKHKVISQQEMADILEADGSEVSECLSFNSFSLYFIPKDGGNEILISTPEECVLISV